MTPIIFLLISENWILTTLAVFKFVSYLICGNYTSTNQIKIQSVSEILLKNSEDLRTRQFLSLLPVAFSSPSLQSTEILELQR